jgi:uncharacterized protein YeaO (DUF488 family)
MPKTIYTVQLANARAAHMEDVPVVDITVKSGDLVFAPTWEMVLEYKAGKLSEEEYMDHYRRLMHVSQDLYFPRWKNILSYDNLALACYCRPGNFCHRHLLKDILMEMWAIDGEDVVDGGELGYFDT